MAAHRDVRFFVPYKYSYSLTYSLTHSIGLGGDPGLLAVSDADDLS